MPALWWSLLLTCKLRYGVISCLFLCCSLGMLIKEELAMCRSVILRKCIVQGQEIHYEMLAADYFQLHQHQQPELGGAALFEDVQRFAAAIKKKADTYQLLTFLESHKGDFPYKTIVFDCSTSLLCRCFGDQHKVRHLLTLREVCLL